MSLLLETIRITKGIPENLSCHEDRITKSQLALDGLRRLPPLIEIFEDHPPPEIDVQKARVIYNRDLYKINYQEYTKKAVKTLQIWQTGSIYYPFKFANRQLFENIKQKLPEFTEALIIVGDRVTDTTYTNVAFLKDNRWFTPANPLLTGTQRCALLQKEIIEPADIRLRDLENFSKIRLFNAMIPWDESIELPSKAIRHL